MSSSGQLWRTIPVPKILMKGTETLPVAQQSPAPPLTQSCSLHSSHSVNTESFPNKLSASKSSFENLPRLSSQETQTGTFILYSFSYCCVANHHKYKQLKTRQINTLLHNKSLAYVSLVLYSGSSKADILLRLISSFGGFSREDIHLQTFSGYRQFISLWLQVSSVLMAVHQLIKISCPMAFSISPLMLSLRISDFVKVLVLLRTSLMKSNPSKKSPS